MSARVLPFLLLCIFLMRSCLSWLLLLVSCPPPPRSCYMNAALQCLLPMDAFVARYGADASRAHALECRAPSHAECFHCQMGKVVDALVSGRYARQPPEFAAWRAARDASRAQSADAAMGADAEAEGADAAERRRADKEASDKLFRDWQPGVTPRMFKSLIAGSHHEFKTNRQQDAFEFIQYFLNEVQRRERANGMMILSLGLCARVISVSFSPLPIAPAFFLSSTPLQASTRPPTFSSRRRRGCSAPSASACATRTRPRPT